MSNQVFLPPKLVGESPILPFDFASRLGVTETISTQVVTATVYSGVDATPSSIISGSATASGTIVSQKVTAGVLGVIYQLACTITTSLGQTLLLTGFLAIVPDVV